MPGESKMDSGFRRNDESAPSPNDEKRQRFAQRQKKGPGKPGPCADEGKIVG
jgi:hypothetical protein